MRLLIVTCFIFVIFSCQSKPVTYLQSASESWGDISVNEIAADAVVGKEVEEVVLVKGERVKTIGISFRDRSKVSFFKFSESNKSDLIKFVQKLLTDSKSISRKFDFKSYSKKSLKGIVQNLNSDKDSDEYIVAKSFLDLLLLKTSDSKPSLLEDGVLFKDQQNGIRTTVYDNNVQRAIVIEKKNLKSLVQNKSSELYFWLKKYMEVGDYPELQKDIKGSGFKLRVVEV